MKTIIELFEYTVSHSGDNLAVTDDFGASLTFADVDDRSSRIASSLLRRGVKPSDSVCVCIQRTVDIIPAAIGIWKAGAVYVPVDAAYPDDRINVIVRECNAALMLKDEDMYPEDDPVQSVFKPSPEDPAVILFTSGTTGRPKGVIHRHKSISAMLPFFCPPELDNQSAVAVFPSFAFVASLPCLFYGMLAATSTHIVSSSFKNDIPSLYRSLKEHNVGHIMLPSVLGVFLIENYDLTGMQIILVGEKVPRFKKHSECTVFTHYGSTEGAPVLLCELNGEDDMSPVGYEMPGMDYMLVDESLEAVKPGDKGELLYSCNYTPSEYLGQKELTAEKWVNIGGKTYYRTGDIMTKMADGRYVFIGRADFMLKIRGNRVEAGEVENSIVSSRIASIRRAVCVQRQVNGNEYLCCFFESDNEVDIEALKSDIGKRLAPYMIPDIWTKVEKWPLNVNGKLMRNSLEIPSNMCRTEAMTSLQAMSIVAKIYSERGISLKFSDVMKTHSDQEIEELIEKCQNVVSSESELPDVNQAPLSFAQRGVYVDCMANPDSTSYNLPILIPMPQAVSSETVISAVKAVIESNPSLKTTVVSDSKGEPYLVECQNVPENYGIRVMHTGEAKAEDFARKLVKPFNIGDGSLLFRMSVLESELTRYLFADFHHLISDGTSMNLFLEELASVLEGNCLKGESMSYLKYSYYENVDKEGFESRKDYWESQISKVNGASEILPDIYDGAVKDRKEKAVRSLLGRNIADAISSKEGVNRSAVFMAAAIRAVYAYTANPEVGIVTVSGGRQDVRIAGNMGMFVTTLPITCVVKETSVSDFLHNTQNLVDGVIANDRFPFTEVASQWGYQPNIMFAFQESLIGNPQVNGQSLGFISLEDGDAKFPIYISVTSSKGHDVVEVRYDPSMYSGRMMQTFADSIVEIVREFSVKENTAAIECCSVDSIKLLDSFHNGLEVVDDGETIVSLFRRAATQFPENRALVYKNCVLTYRELDSMTNAIASFILKKVEQRDNLPEEPVVAVLIHRSEWIGIASLAVLKAGLAYQPLDPSYPKERLQFMTTDSKAVILIADKDLVELIPDFEGEVVLTSNLADVSMTVGEPPQVEIKDSSLFILLYTSGTTGTPKGVMLEHRNLVAFCRWYMEFYDLTPSDKVAAYASYGFDACMMDFYPALTTGACVHIIPEEIRLDLEALNGYFERNGVTHSFMTTQVGVQFTSLFKESSLRHLSIGGEKMPAMDPPGGYAFYNVYGPTECTIFSTVYKVEKKEYNIPIGRSVGRLDCFVMDANLHRLPPGAAGELIIAGNQVARGYMNRPDLTEKSFFTLDGQRAYHSGDIVRLRFDGNIEFVGRKDGQVKIRGFRIELKEVETVIREYPGIRDVTVQAFNNADGTKYLAAYIVADETVEISAVNSFIALRKPLYMVPAAMAKIDRIPLNVNLKVDRKALPAIELHETSAVEFVEPETETEKIVAASFAKVLGINGKISALDNFSFLGGDSIKAIRLVTALKQENLSITVGQIIKSGSVREIAAETVLAYGTTFDQKPFAGPVEPNPLMDYFNRLELKVPGYFNQAFLLKAVDRIDSNALRSALDELLDHHDMLRSVLMNGRLYVREAGSPHLYDLEQHGPCDVRSLSEQIQRSIDLANGPIVKCAIVNMEECDYLLMAIHHLAVDGISWRIIVEDLGSAYISALNGKTVKLPDKTASYDLYSRSLIPYRKSTTLQHQLPYWTSVEEKAARCALSQDKSKGFHPMRKTLILNKKSSNALLKESSRAYRTEIDDLFLSAIAMTYNKITGREELSILMESHGRETFDPSIEFDRTVGWFTSIYPVVLEDLSQDIRKTILKTKRVRRAIPDKGFGFPQLKGIPVKDIPLFTFNYLGQLDEASDGSFFKICQDYEIGNLIAPENRYGTDIVINAFLCDGSLHFVADFNDCRFDDDMMGTACNEFKNCLLGIVSHTAGVASPEVSAADLGETQWSVEEFTDIRDDYLLLGENIEAIHHLSRQQKAAVHNYVLNPDSLSGIKRLMFDISAHIDESSFAKVLQDLYDKHSVLRSSVAVGGDGRIPRVVVTDKKPLLNCKDFTAEMDPYARLNEYEDLISHLAFNIQYESPMRMVMVKVSAQQTFFICVCQSMLLNNEMIRVILADFFDGISPYASQSNASEWADLLRTASSIEKDRDHALESDGSVMVSGTRAVSEDEKEMALLFSELLDIDLDNVYLETDFLSLGGDNFGIVELSREIEKRFGVFVPVAKILENPTPSSVLNLVRTSANDAVRPDVYTYSCHPGKKNLFFVHTANTGSEAYINLARRISDHCSFYAFDQYNLNHPESLVEGGIEGIATKYISIMQSYQPHGPYLLGGWCYGGTVAMEMASQLKIMGEEVEHLILLDSHIIDDDNFRKVLLTDFVAGNRRYLSTSPLFEGLRSRGMLDNLIRNSAKVSRDWLYYTPPYYDGDVTYFKAKVKEKELSGAIDRMYDILLGESASGYEKYIPQDRLNIVDVQETHDSLMSERALDVIVPEILRIVE